MIIFMRGYRIFFSHITTCIYICRFDGLKTHYEILGVDKNATQTKIKDQFIKLSKEVRM